MSSSSLLQIFYRTQQEPKISDTDLQTAESLDTEMAVCHHPSSAHIAKLGITQKQRGKLESVSYVSSIYASKISGKRFFPNWGNQSGLVYRWIQIILQVLCLDDVSLFQPSVKEQ